MPPRTVGETAVVATNKTQDLLAVVKRATNKRTTTNGNDIIDVMLIDDSLDVFAVHGVGGMAEDVLAPLRRRICKGSGQAPPHCGLHPVTGGRAQDASGFQQPLLEWAAQ